MDGRGEPRFVADAMLGRLARWLRLMGFDTRYDPRGEDDRLAALAAAEGRWLVTRDTRLAARAAPGLRTILVRSNHHREQIDEVMAAVGRPVARPLTRCAECNGELREVSREEVAAEVPDHVLAVAERFHRCAGCGRVYWPGSHLDGIRDVIEGRK
jgi:uncharacterized protein with PIN domain